MKKRITKTIGLIVFVMFLNILITDVHAVSGDVALSCVYDAPDDEIVIINITNSGSAVKAESSTFNGDILNWTNQHKYGFDGQQYYVDHHECPEYAVYNKEIGPDDVIFAEDYDQAKKIKKYVIGGTIMDRTDQILGVDASQAVREAIENNDAVKKLKLPKHCACSGKTPSGTSISLEFDVEKNYSQPGRLKIHFGEATNKEEIENWNQSYDRWFHGEKSHYYYLQDLLANDKCPDYAIVARRGIGNLSYFLLVSDEENLEGLRSDAGGDTYPIACTDEQPTPTSNSNSTPKKSNNPKIDEPDVNSNAVRTLTYDVSTYSCGKEYMTGIPARIPKLGKFIMNLLQILIPIILIIYGSLDLLRAVYSSKEDDIKKSQQTFVKRLTGSILIFFVFAIVKLVISVVSTNNSRIMECVDCILRYSDNCYEEE